MNESDQAYGDLIRIDPSGEAGQETLRRIPLGTAVSAGGIDESSLRNLLFEFPGSLPVGSIDAAYAHPVPVCRELSTPAGYVDAVYVNALGRLVLAEFKLWRNPQARREVIGQILDYAKEFASWSYEDLQREVSRALGRKGNVVYELVRSQAPDLDEADFVDNVSRHLARGEFLLLIVGDGIREGVENIVDFVQRHSGLHFTLALVEAALYRDTGDRIIVQPRCLARTEVVSRLVFGEGEARPEPDGADEPPSDREQENARFWTAVLRDYAFSDVAVEVPDATKGAHLDVAVPNSGFGSWGLWFTGYVYRRNRDVGCYLACRKGIDMAERIFAGLVAELDGLRGDLGDDLQYWENDSGRPRIGFRRETQLPFAPEGEPSNEFDEAVAWMRDRLDRLVSTLHPRLRRLLRSVE
ncbi:MAG: hypothetical protein F4089_10450 [Gammaproteobacteria bacterium]|nr:hypothetical protein [Gammaproteobacteria bacterium]